MDNYYSLPQIPEIPTGYAYNMAHVWWICPALILAGIIYLVLACRLAWKTNNWLPVTIWIAGFLFVFHEAVNCLLNCIYWTVSPDEKFTLFNGVCKVLVGEITAGEIFGNVFGVGIVGIVLHELLESGSGHDEASFETLKA